MAPDRAGGIGIDPFAVDFLRLPTLAELGDHVLRLVIAAGVGALIGAERESVGKPAGLRTHMLVALGAALFALLPSGSGRLDGDLGRVIQGVATGVGFLGAGTIIKRADREDVSGLTTAASIWLTAALGLAVGVGRLWLPVVCAGIAWVILRLSALAGRGHP